MKCVEVTRNALLVISLCSAPRVTGASEAQAPPKPVSELANLDVEDLLKLQVTTSSKKSQPLSDVPAAVYVITQEDIRRSGATSILEALRLAPGVQVAQIDANKWAISVRGFNTLWSNKLLVLIDGQSVYNLMSSGVFWDSQDLVMEDVDRIEVIRGPGGTVWGANAVNGVINIITKNARETQGSLVATDSGNQTRAAESFRLGQSLGANTYYRIYGKNLTQNPLSGQGGSSSGDHWDSRRVGLRVDSGEGQPNRLMFQANAYHNELGSTASVPILQAPYSQRVSATQPVSGWNALARWEHSASAGSQRSLQVYIDESDHTQWYGDGEDILTLDLDLQNRQPLAGPHDLVWGLGYRRTGARFHNSPVIQHQQTKNTDNLWNAFAQDEIALRPKLHLDLGTKFEYSSYSGFEIEPSAHLLWKPDDRHTYWAAVSRAVRTPSFFDRGSFVAIGAAPGQDGIPSLIALVMNPNIGSEHVLAYETGARFQPSSRLYVDTTAFYNLYDHLQNHDPGTPYLVNDPSQPYRVIPLVSMNSASARTAGLEITSKWTATHRWRLTASGSLFTASFRHDAPGGTVGMVRNDASPSHELSIQSNLDLPHHLEFDTLFFGVGKLAGANVPGYDRLDIRLGWRPQKKYELSLGVQNLLGQGHQEFASDSGVVASSVDRLIYGKFVWRP
jgi:iron complex outermembrane receptor protein